MKAAAYYSYGGPEVLEIVDLPIPSPKANEVLIKVESTTVTAGTMIVRKGRHPEFPVFNPMIRLMFGLFKPRSPITGYEFSGIIEEVGAEVSTFQKGDRVFGTTTGLKSGSYAQYICVPESWKQGVIAQLPEAISYDEGAALPIGAMTAYSLMNKLPMTNKTNVMIYGASGSVGTYMLQYAKSKGATVTAVCSHKNHELVLSLGADYVLDYTSSSYSNASEKYDIIADAVGKMLKTDRKKFLKTDGYFTSIAKLTEESLDGLKVMIDLVVEKKVNVFIDRTYDLADISAAHRYAETGHKRGNVVIKM